MTTAIGGRNRLMRHAPLRPLTPEEQELFIANYGLVMHRVLRMSIAWHMRDRYKRWKTKFYQQMDEYAGFCSIGLCIAVQRYDQALGKFSTLAFRWIHAYATLATRQSELKIGRIRDKERTDWPPVLLFSDEEHRLWLSHYASANSLPIWDCVREAVAPPQENEDAEHLACVKRIMLNLLGKRYFDIFWLSAVDGLNNEAIGKSRGVSRERIRQILERSLALLRESPEVANALCEFRRDPREVRRHEAKGVSIPTFMAR